MGCWNGRWQCQFLIDLNQFLTNFVHFWLNPYKFDKFFTKMSIKQSKLVKINQKSIQNGEIWTKVDLFWLFWMNRPDFELFWLNSNYFLSISNQSIKMNLFWSRWCRFQQQIRIEKSQLNPIRSRFQSKFYFKSI